MSVIDRAISYVGHFFDSPHTQAQHLQTEIPSESSTKDRFHQNPNELSEITRGARHVKGERRPICIPREVFGSHPPVTVDISEIDSQGHITTRSFRTYMHVAGEEWNSEIEGAGGASSFASGRWRLVTEPDPRYPGNYIMGQGPDCRIWVIENHPYPNPHSLETPVDLDRFNPNNTFVEIRY